MNTLKSFHGLSTTDCTINHFSKKVTKPYPSLFSLITFSELFPFKLLSKLNDVYRKFEGSFTTLALVANFSITVSAGNYRKTIK